MKLLKDENSANLQDAFLDLVRGGDLEVVGKLTATFDAILPSLYKRIASEQPATDSNGNNVLVSSAM